MNVARVGVKVRVGVEKVYYENLFCFVYIIYIIDLRRHLGNCVDKNSKLKKMIKLYNEQILLFADLVLRSNQILNNQILSSTEYGVNVLAIHSKK